MAPQGRAHVFCRDCRFFLDANRPQQQRCLHPHARYFVATAVEVEQRWRTPHARNAHNDCPDWRPWRRWERLRLVDPAFLGVGGLLLVALMCAWCTFTGR